LYVDHLPGYGYEYWYAQYLAAIGSPCGDMYADQLHAGVYYRKYSGGFVVVNASSTVSFTLNLPQLSYTNLEGQGITSPLALQADAAQVLLTTNGCR
jgi:hypothetical protein